MNTSGPLSGSMIAVPESRELELFARMLEEQGASVLRCPMVGILDAPDAAPVEAWLRRLAAGQFNDLIFLTGEGIRRLRGFAQRAGIEKDVVAAIGAARKITRGPKPARALREIGLRPDLPAAEPTTAGVIKSMSELDLKGRNTGVQLYGEEPNLPLIDFLKSAGAVPFPVAPYIYAPAAHDTQVLELVRKMGAGQLDAIAFTSGAQVKRLNEIAAANKLEAELKAGLARIIVAAVGPVVAQELESIGRKPDVVPETSFFLKPLIDVLILKMKTG